MKIAVFGTCWNEEGIRYYLDGFKNWAMDYDAIIDVFTCYGTIGLEDRFNWGEYRLYDLPDLKEYDGVILIDSTINEPRIREHLYKKVQRADIPCITIDNKVKGFSSIGIDQKYHMKQLTEHLIQVHHVESFCYVGAPKESVEAEARLRGFLFALEENHIAIHSEWMFEKNFDYQDGIDVVRKVAGKDMPQAFVCANDDMASGVCDELISMGMKIGQDVYVTGFDNYFLGENYSPRLTTARRPRESITYRACEMLMHQFTHGKKIENIFQQGNIVLGETCGCNRELCGNHKEFRRIIFQREQNKSYVNNLLADMEEKIVSGESLEAVVANVGNMLSTLGIGRCRIVLAPDVEQLEQGRHEDYRDCTKSCLIYQDNHREGMKLEGHTYVYVPIHFQDHLYGYCTFMDIDQLMVDRQLYQFVKTIGLSIENVVEKKKYERLNAKLETLYETDQLTGTYNRHGMKMIADKFLNVRIIKDIPVDIIFVDIDYLKKINDTYGHEEGDYTIRVVGNALLHFQDDNCKVFRYGGDEFIILRQSQNDFSLFAQRIRNRIEELQNVENKPFTVSASIGCVTAQPTDHLTLKEYITKADKEMYLIKKQRHA